MNETTEIPGSENTKFEQSVNLLQASFTAADNRNAFTDGFGGSDNFYEVWIHQGKNKEHYNALCEEFTQQREAFIKSVYDMPTFIEELRNSPHAVFAIIAEPAAAMYLPAPQNIPYAKKRGFITKLFRWVLKKEAPLDLGRFNEKFVEGNQALALGNTDGLKIGLTHLIESLEYAGPFTKRLVPAIKSLRCALSHHDRADTKGPWNRDLSGYGLFSWKNDLYDRDTALREAWPNIEAVNRDLKSQGLGWNY